MWGSKKGPARNFTFLAPKPDNNRNYKGPDILYINVEGYIWKMIPGNCYKNTTFSGPVQYTKLFIDGYLANKKIRSNIEPATWTIMDFKEGQNFTIEV